MIDHNCSQVLTETGLVEVYWIRLYWIRLYKILALEMYYFKAPFVKVVAITMSPKAYNLALSFHLKMGNV